MVIAYIAAAILGCGAEDAARPGKWAEPVTLAGVPNQGAEHRDIDRQHEGQIRQRIPSIVDDTNAAPVPVGRWNLDDDDSERRRE